MTECDTIGKDGAGNEEENTQQGGFVFGGPVYSGLILLCGDSEGYVSVYEVFTPSPSLPAPPSPHLTSATPSQPYIRLLAKFCAFEGRPITAIRAENLSRVLVSSGSELSSWLCTPAAATPSGPCSFFQAEWSVEKEEPMAMLSGRGQDDEEAEEEEGEDEQISRRRAKDMERGSLWWDLLSLGDGLTRVVTLGGIREYVRQLLRYGQAFLSLHLHRYVNICLFVCKIFSRCVLRVTRLQLLISSVPSTWLAFVDTT